jgi:hypothetical protein
MLYNRNIKSGEDFRLKEIQEIVPIKAKKKVYPKKHHDVILKCRSKSLDMTFYSSIDPDLLKSILEMINHEY